MNLALLTSTVVSIGLIGTAVAPTTSPCETVSSIVLSNWNSSSTSYFDHPDFISPEQLISFRVGQYDFWVNQLRAYFKSQDEIDSETPTVRFIDYVSGETNFRDFFDYACRYFDDSDVERFLSAVASSEVDLSGEWFVEALRTYSNSARKELSIMCKNILSLY